MRANRFVTAIGFGLLMLAGPAFSHEAGSWVVRAGFHTIQPKSDNGVVSALAADVEVDGDEQFTFDITYMLSERWGVELLAALPFEHDIDIGGATLASTKHLPPTLSAVYYFNPQSPVSVYAGLGLNVTLFFEEDTRGALAGADLELDNSVGAAALVGFDVSFGERWFLNADVRYFDIDTDATVSAPGLVLKEQVEIDPWAVGVKLGFRL